jgi:RNA polymerase sigma factor (sigma-70 family)
MGMDKNKFVKLVEGHSRMIYKIAGAYAKTASDREDLISETVLQLWRSSNNFEGKCKLSTCIYRVALNTAMYFNRSQKNRSLFLQLI